MNVRHFQKEQNISQEEREEKCFKKILRENMTQ